MFIAKALRKSGFALFALGVAFVPSLASAQPYTGGINVQGTKGALCSITVHDDAVTLNLDTSTSGVGTQIGTITQNCNKLAGYTLTVSSQNCETATDGAKMMSGGAEIQPYTVSFVNPGPANVTGLLATACTGAPVVTGRDVTNAKVDNEVSTVHASYTAIGSLSSGSYTDVLTITMAVK